jgi:hypothetical protein
MKRTWRIAVLLVLGAITWFAATRRLHPLSDPTTSGQLTGHSANFDHLIQMIEDTMQEESARVEVRTSFAVPLSKDEIRDAVQNCLQHVLTDPDLADSREFYGTPGALDVVLVNDDIAWPDGLDLKIEGLRLRFGAQSNSNPEGDRILGVFLGKLDVRGPATGFFDQNIILTLGNVGGARNGGVIGGCLVSYTVDKVGDVVQVRYAGWRDP